MKNKACRLVCFAAVVVLCAGCGSGLTKINTTDEFQSYVRDAEKPVILEFYRSGCASCFLLGPTLDSLAEDYEGNFLFYRIESKDSEELRQRYSVIEYPTVILFVRGVEQHRWVNEQAKPSYKQVLDLLLMGA